MSNPSFNQETNPSDQTPNPVSIRAWGQKLLVALLCIASFYGGWKSYESNMANACFANGGQINESGRVLLCQLP